MNRIRPAQSYRNSGRLNVVRDSSITIQESAGQSIQRQAKPTTTTTTTSSVWPTYFLERSEKISGGEMISEIIQLGIASKDDLRWIWWLVVDLNSRIVLALQQ